MTKNVDKGTDELTDTLLSEKNPRQRRSRRLLMNWQIHYCLRINLQILMLKKGTSELAFMKKRVNTIRRKVLNRFEGQSTGTKEWFKLYIEFF